MGMSCEGLLDEMVRRIRQAVQPEKIVLFGSRARGDAHPQSDFDFLIIQHSDQPRYRRSGPVYSALADIPAEVEVIVYTPQEVQEWRNVPRAFVTTAIREGRVLYESKG